MNEVERRSGNAWERHFQSAVGALAVLILFGLYQGVTDVQAGQAVIANEITWMKGSMADFKSQLDGATNDTYTQHDAKRDKSILDLELKFQRKRMKDLEDAIEDLRKRLK